MSFFFLFTSLLFLCTYFFFFFFNDTATTEIYTLSLHDALPIWPRFTSSRSAAMGHPRSSGRSGSTTHEATATRPIVRWRATREVRALTAPRQKRVNRSQLARLESRRRPRPPPCGHAVPTTTGGQTRPTPTAPRRADQDSGGRAGGAPCSPAALAASPDQVPQPRTGILQRGIVGPQRQRTDHGLMLPISRGRRREGCRVRRPPDGEQHRQGHNDPGGALMEHPHDSSDGIPTANRPKA